MYKIGLTLMVRARPEPITPRELGRPRRRDEIARAAPVWRKQETSSVWIFGETHVFPSFRAGGTRQDDRVILVFALPARGRRA